MDGVGSVGRKAAVKTLLSSSFQMPLGSGQQRLDPLRRETQQLTENDAAKWPAGIKAVSAPKRRGDLANRRNASLLELPQASRSSPVHRSHRVFPCFCQSPAKRHHLSNPVGK